MRGCGEVRWDLVGTLRAAIAEGRYQVDDAALVWALIERYRDV